MSAKLDDSDVQKAHDSILALANQSGATIPLPGGPFLSLKVLTSGAGVFLSDAKFQQELGVGAVAVFLKPG